MALVGELTPLEKSFPREAPSWARCGGGALGIYGLNPGTTYTFIVFSSCAAGITSNIRVKASGGNAGEAAFSPTANTSEVAIVGGIKPTILGDISLVINAFTPMHVNGNYFLGALEIRDDAEPDTWGGYVISDSEWVDTETWLGWINISADPWIWNVDMNKYIYLPEEFVGEAGAWSYFPN
jgi:hypothetical protein